MSNSPKPDSPPVGVPTPKAAKKKGSYWAYAPVVLLGFLMSIVGAMVVISTNDPNFAVEPDYYQKAVDWDKKRAQDAENERLGWKVSWTFEAASVQGGDDNVGLQLDDAEGAPLEGAIVSIEAFHNAHAAEIQSVSLRDEGAGRYRGKLRLSRSGVWEFRLLVTHHGYTFTRVHRAEFAANSFALNLLRTRTAQRELPPANAAVALGGEP